MKVLKKGRDQTGWSQELFCTGEGNGGGGCGALLLVERPDIFCTANLDYLGDGDYYHTFKCSECGVLTDFEGPGNPRNFLSYREWEKARQNSREMK